MTSLTLIASGFWLWNGGYNLIATICLVAGLSPILSRVARGVV